MLKPNVLRRKKDFSAIYNKGKSVGERYVVLFYRKNQLPYNRKAFLASKKVGNSVKRNRARRLMKESYRQMEEILPVGYDLIIIARNTINDLKCADVKKSLEAAMRKAKIIKTQDKRIVKGQDRI
ncbi:MAG: ribonuclease P protein component [Anaerovorax sp.]